MAAKSIPILQLWQLSWEVVWRKWYTVRKDESTFFIYLDHLSVVNSSATYVQYLSSAMRVTDLKIKKGIIKYLYLVAVYEHLNVPFALAADGIAQFWWVIWTLGNATSWGYIGNRPHMFKLFMSLMSCYNQSISKAPFVTQFDNFGLVILFCCLLLLQMEVDPLFSEITQWSCCTPGSLWEMPDSKSEPLPHKSAFD